MKYKGYELVIDIDETNDCFIFRITGIVSQSTINNNINPTSHQVIEWFKDTIDLHLNHSILKYNFNRETIGKIIRDQESHFYSWDDTKEDFREVYRKRADDIINYIKNQ